MRLRILLLCLIPHLALADDVYFFEIGPAIATPTGPEVEAENPLLFLRAGVESKYLKVEFGHQSSIDHGPPINGKKDHKDQNHIAILFRYTTK